MSYFEISVFDISGVDLYGSQQEQGIMQYVGAQKSRLSMCIQAIPSVESEVDSERCSTFMQLTYILLLFITLQRHYNAGVGSHKTEPGYK